MALQGKVRAAYNAIRDRLEADTDLKDYFAMIDYDFETEKKEYHYIKIDYLGFRTEPSQVPLNEAPVLILGAIVITETDDMNKIAEHNLKGIEIFVNAFMGTAGDPTFSNRVLKFNMEFEAPEVLEAETEDDKYKMISTGVIEIDLQHYQQGNL